MVLGLSIAGGVGVVIGGLLSKVISPQWFRRCIVLLLVVRVGVLQCAVDVNRMCK
jgi:uncharacterized membrane protein YfcA